MEKIARVNQEIPLDLLLEILTKLPVKSLCRFRSVCKLWRSVTADPGFAEAHRASSAARPELLILFQGREKVNGVKVIHRAYTCKLDSELHSVDNLGLTRTYHNLVPVQDPALERGFVSHRVDGLYCLDFSHSVRIWNPNTRESRGIKTLVTKWDDMYEIVNYFGFDPVEKKHKVLNLLKQHGRVGKVVKSRVFILEENCWRDTANAHPLLLPRPIMYSGTTKAICIDGIIFYPTGWGGRNLMAFHVRLETFQEIVVPEPSRPKTVIEFAGRAALVNSDFDFDQGITLWLLKDLQQHVWTLKLKARVVPYDLGRLELEGGTPSGELIFTGGRAKHFFIPLFVLLYNVESNVARRIELQGLQLPKIDTFWIHFVHFHVESLRSHRTYQEAQQIEV